MPKRMILALLVSMFLLFLTFGARFNGVVMASKSVLRVPESFSTIQEAINAASSGETILVSARTYHELLKVNKTVRLVGDDPSTTIIDGDEAGTVISVNASNGEIRGFTIQNGKRELPYCGIFIFKSRNVTISNNIIRKNYYGIDLRECNSSIIFSNIIANNSFAGIVASGNSNYFYDNTVENNANGVWIPASTTPNVFYHNNFLNNTNQALLPGQAKWDNGAEGNFWSDYNGSDGNGDGIGDATYPYELGWDKYPLMEPWRQRRIFGDVIISSNCTIASFNLNSSLKQLSFRITGPSGSKFFFNITVPKVVLQKTFSEKWVVKLNSTDVTAKSQIEENASAYFISLLYDFGSSYEVQIKVVTSINYFFGYLIACGVVIVIIGVVIVMFKRRKKTTSRFSRPHGHSFTGK